MRNHFLRAAGGGAGVLSDLTITASDGSQTDSSTYTFSSQSVGSEEGANRYVVVCAAAARLSAGFAFDSITVDGNTASILTQATASAGSSIANALAIYHLPNGTTASIGLELNATAAYSSIHVGYFTARPGYAPALVDSYAQTSPSGSSITVSDTTSTSRGGLVIVNAASGNEAWTSWSGVSLLATRDMNSNDNHEVCSAQSASSALSWSGGHAGAYDLLTVCACSLY